MLRQHEVRLAQLLIRRQWCTLQQITEALDYQKNLKAKEQQRALGMLLVQSGALEENRLRQALADLGVLSLRCHGCSKTYRITRFDPDHDYRCPDCQSQLELADPSSGSGQTYPYDSGSERASALAPDRYDEEPDRDPMLGKVLGGCQLVEMIAAGGMGVVYKARQLNLNRTVAVKILSDDLSRDVSFVRRFIEEARAAGQLNHGNIVHINDVGEYQGTFYFTMEYVEGQNLKIVLKKERRLPIARALDVTLQVCYALQHAHNRGIVHRDIKPENIMLTAEGTVKLADLGLAKRLTPSGDNDLTQVGSILGTPYYIAPEQAKDFGRVDKRSDIYSLGVTLFLMISGTIPFAGRSPIEIMIKVVQGKRAPLSQVCDDVSPEVERIVDRMMWLDPDQRYQNVDQLIADIREVTEALESRTSSEATLEKT